jgi:hypothetical protein
METARRIEEGVEYFQVSLRMGTFGNLDLERCYQV